MSDSDGRTDNAETLTAGAIRIRSVTVGAPPLRVDGPIELRAYDEAWPVQFAADARRLREVLGDRALLVEHVGSTSVPGLAAKPIIDMLLVVADSAVEHDYVPPLERAGYTLRIREPDWYEHRLLKGPSVDINLHVFSDGCVEIDRMLRFRDHLRTDAADRERYSMKKHELAARSWAYVQEYADAKTDVVEEIIARSHPESRASHTG